MQMKMAVSLENLCHHGEQRFQSLAADGVGGLPENDQRLSNRLVVEARPAAGFDPGLHSQHGTVENPNCVFAVIAGGPAARKVVHSPV